MKKFVIDNIYPNYGMLDTKILEMTQCHLISQRLFIDQHLIRYYRLLKTAYQDNSPIHGIIIRFRNNTEHYMDPYVAGVRISAAIFAVLGVVAHCTVAYLSKRKAKHDDIAYVCLMQIYSFTASIRILSGWFVTNRAVTLDSNSILIFAYGPGGLLPSAYSRVALCLSAQFGLMTVVFIPICMGIRALIIFNKPVTRKIVYSIVGSLYFISFIVLSIMITIMSDAPVESLPDYLLKRAEITPIVAELTNIFEVQFVYAGSNSSYFCVPITFVLRYIMVRKLNQLVKTVSGRQSKLHKSFVTLLTLEASVLLIGVFVTIMRYLANSSFPIPPEVGNFLSEFSFPILLFMHMLQGVFTLILVPYIRHALLKPFRKCYLLNAVIPASAEYSTQIK